MYLIRQLLSSSSRDEVSGQVLQTGKAGATLSKEIVDAWASLPADVRAALVSSELSSSGRSGIETQETVSSMTSSNNSDASGEKECASELEEECPVSGTKMILKPLERAPENVFEFTKTTSREHVRVEKTPSAVVTTKTTVVTSSRGWRNVFSLPISYDVNVVPHGTLLDPTNPQLLEATGVHPEGYNRRFAVIDKTVDEIYGDKIRSYFVAHNIDLHTCILPGGEPDKRPDVSFSLNISCKCKIGPVNSRFDDIVFRPSTNCSTQCVSTNFVVVNLSLRLVAESCSTLQEWLLPCIVVESHLFAFPPRFFLLLMPVLVSRTVWTIAVP